MNTQLYKSLTILLFIGVLMASCQTKPKKNSKNDVQFSTIEKEKTYHLLDNQENPNCNLQLSFTYPTEYNNKEILHKIQYLFVYSYFGEAYETLSPEKAVARYTEDYLEAYKELEEDFKEEVKNADTTPVGSWYSYYEMSTNDINFNMDDILCFTVCFENYTGGAHGSHSATNHVINLKTGELITEKDVFIDGFEDRLAQILVDHIASQNNVENIKELENIGFFSVDEIYPNNNFLVNETGITYSFNEYEIAAYVVGITNVHLPYEKIHHLLRTESPIAHLYAH